MGRPALANRGGVVAYAALYSNKGCEVGVMACDDSDSLGAGYDEASEVGAALLSLTEDDLDGILCELRRLAAIQPAASLTTP